MKQKYFTFRFTALDGMVPSFRRVYISIIQDQEAVTLQLQVNKVVKVYVGVLLSNVDITLKKISPYLFKHQVEVIERFIKTELK